MGRRSQKPKVGREHTEENKPIKKGESRGTRGRERGREKK